MRQAYLAALVLVVGAGVAWFAASARAQGDDVLTFLFSLGTPKAGTSDGVAGELGEADGEFVFPFGVAIDTTGRFLITDSYELIDYDGDGCCEIGNRLQIFGPDGTLERVIRGPADTPFSYPTSVAVDDRDQIVVTDNDNNRILVFSPAYTRVDTDNDGTAEVVPAEPQLLNTFGDFGNFDPLSPADDPSYEYFAPGTAPMDRFYWPSGVSVKPATRLLDPADHDGRVAIVDNGNHRVVVLNSQLVPLFQFGGHTSEDNPPGTFEYPWAVAIGTVGGETRFFVSDTENHRVQVFDENGSFLWSFGADTSGGAPAPGDLSAPSGLTIDSSGRLLVADTNRSRVLRIDVTHPLTGSALPPCADLFESRLWQQCQLETSQGQHYAALVLGGADSGVLSFRYAQGVATDSQDRVAVVDTDRQLVRVFQPARLKILSATATSSTNPVVVGDPVDLKVSVRSEGGEALPVTLHVSPSLPGTLIGDFNRTIQAGGTEEFEFTFLPDRAGALTFSITAEGLHSSGARVDALEVTTESVPVAAAAVHLFATVEVDDTFVAIGETVTVTISLHNTGNTDFVEALAAVSAAPPSLVQLAQSPASPGGSLAAGSSRSLEYRYTAQAEGTVSFSAQVAAKYGSEEQDYPAFTATSEDVRISTDATPPLTTPSYDQPDGTNGWYRNPFKVKLVAQDAGSGVKSISYKVLGVASSSGMQTGDRVEIPIVFDGTTTISFFATDNAGNSERPQTLEFRLDSTPPMLGRVAMTPSPNADGWHHTDVVLQPIAGDGTSGVVAVLPLTVTTEGANQTFTFDVYDVAGNVSSIDVTVNIDKTPPTVSCGTISQGALWPPNHRLVPWVTFVAVSDALSRDAGFVLAAATSTEPDNGRGDGSTTDDIQGFDIGTADTAGFVRAERSGPGGGRIYSLSYEGRDLAGNVASCVAVAAQVAHDQSGGKAGATAGAGNTPKKK